MKANTDIRAEAKAAGIFLWQIADRLGFCDMTMSRKLRKELPAEEKARIQQIIAELKAEGSDEQAG